MNRKKKQSDKVTKCQSDKIVESSKLPRITCGDERRTDGRDPTARPAPSSRSSARPRRHRAPGRRHPDRHRGRKFVSYLCAPNHPLVNQHMRADSAVRPRLGIIPNQALEFSGKFRQWLEYY
ncbi:MAG: hypothetical protein UV20_C0029G0007 [Candidatus Magasanikbacteria bacterium GW2011_GWA2_42_32]|uniref:Uncharacterized protein n=1 Tax=Candidatus Magasanikbacteria bacterium GW2011_GWA2_42_32 TaxID=1619039 RepID=A0A0G1CYW0_9BACT|nr:MAG: hypothetical protein UV20_C0029G0007 [Candidatus Magasanikbacteria bacterium GW2011_GWA2_42_32]